MNVFIAEMYATEALAILRARRDLQFVDSPKTCEILLIRSQTRIDKDFLKAAPNVKMIVTATSGFDHIDWRECVARQITVSHTPDANAGATAELTLFLMSALLRNTLGQIDNAKRGKWRDGLVRGSSLEGQTVGIVGLGRVGRRVARLAGAYGMKIVGHDPYVSADVFSSLGVERLAFVELLRASEIVTFHVPLTRETKHMINLPTLREMQSETYLVNCSRGAVIDESEVLVALREGHLSGCAFDVLEREPPITNSELLRTPNVILTPHVGAFTIQAFERASVAACERVIEFLEEKPVADTLPLSVPWFDSV